MQTFLPFPDFEKSAKVLDYRRLGKQRVECVQLLSALSGVKKGWVNHPAAKMWRGHELALAKYKDICIREWISRGYKNTLPLSDIQESAPFPAWFGDELFHRSHQSNLLRKDPVFYGPHFPGVPNDLPYLWPI
jgi:Pyrimidine dimer DNA glycosylase